MYSRVFLLTNFSFTEFKSNDNSFPQLIKSIMNRLKPYNDDSAKNVIYTIVLKYFFQFNRIPVLWYNFLWFHRKWLGSYFFVTMIPFIQKNVIIHLLRWYFIINLIKNWLYMTYSLKKYRQVLIFSRGMPLFASESNIRE